ncbi:MAG: ATP-binding cassette domain-containing protein [Micromonosporaceae bacterium]|nr:ATP-binding cassette domain-containing protein [Micromonosporaceae bacterium]
MIVIKHLTKRYGRHQAVDDVSFRCEAGTVTGFLGPNGAGKSTTLRVICGLTRPTCGTATVLGVPYRRLGNPGRRVGSMLDASALHSGRTGRETLALSAALLGVPADQVDTMLGRVGLDRQAARRRVGRYSLGMRQRLSIAGALLGDPTVLVLDEPANGLDPEGIYWMRQLLRDFADRGGTVLLSSHLLHEVEAIADRLVVINAGRIMAQGRRQELLAASGTLVRAVDPTGLRASLTAAGLAVAPVAPASPFAAGDGALLVSADPETIGQIAVSARMVLLELRPADHGGLERLYLNLTAPSDQAPRESELVP